MKSHNASEELEILFLNDYFVKYLTLEEWNYWNLSQCMVNYSDSCVSFVIYGKILLQPHIFAKNLSAYYHFCLKFFIFKVSVGFKHLKIFSIKVIF